MRAWDDEHVTREERSVVEEGDRVGTIEDEVGGRIARDDPAEQAVTGQADEYGRWRAFAASRFGTITLRRKKQTSSPRWL